MPVDFESLGDDAVHFVCLLALWSYGSEFTVSVLLAA